MNDTNTIGGCQGCAPGCNCGCQRITNDSPAQAAPAHCGCGESCACNPCRCFDESR